MSTPDTATPGIRASESPTPAPCPVGLYIRNRSGEPEEFTRTAPERRGGALAQALTRHPRGIGAGFGITITWTVATHFVLVHLPTYAQESLRITAGEALLANAAGVLVLLVLAPIFGTFPTG